MAKQFGDFLGIFLEYDTPVPKMGVQKYMRIKVKPDVNASLKRRKKIIVGSDRIFYACFQYEKLSIFCFICGKMGHEESFYSLRVRMNPFKISFGWDASLRAATRRRTTTISRWLRESDGSVCTST